MDKSLEMFNVYLESAFGKGCLCCQGFDLLWNPYPHLSWSLSCNFQVSLKLVYLAIGGGVASLLRKYSLLSSNDYRHISC